jgi:hypothetical protein
MPARTRAKHLTVAHVNNDRPERAAPHASRGPARSGFAPLMALSLLMLCATGCAPSINWQVGWYHDIHPQAAAAEKLTFVYFKSYFVPECTPFEEEQLKNPDVLNELNADDEIVCIPLTDHWNAELIAAWRIERLPAYVIVAPEGDVLARNSWPITLEEVLADIRSSKAENRRRKAPPDQ